MSDSDQATASTTSSSKFVISWPVIATAFALIALFVSIAAIVIVTKPIRTIQNWPLLPDTNNEILKQAQETVSLASEQINQYLALLQAMTAILGIAGGVITVFGVLNLSRVGELRNEINTLYAEMKEQSKETARTQKNLEKTQGQVEKELGSLSGFEQALEARLNTKLEDNRRVAQSVAQIQFAVDQADLGNFTAALAILEDLHTSLSDNPVVNYYLGDFLARQGDIDKGADYLERAQEAKYFWAAKASYAYVLRLKADRMTVKTAQQEQYAKVDHIFHTIYAEAPLLLDVQGESAFGAWAGLHKRQGDFQQAIQIYEHCAQVTPPSSYPLINLGTIHLQNLDNPTGNFAGDYDAGLRYFTQAAEKCKTKMLLNPTDHWPVFDAILSTAVLEDTEPKRNEIRQLWQHVLGLKVIDSNIAKLKNDLNKLADVPKLADRIKAVIAIIELPLTQ